MAHGRFLGSSPTGSNPVALGWAPGGGFYKLPRDPAMDGLYSTLEDTVA